MINTEKAQKILEAEYRKLSTGFDELYSSGSDSDRAMIDEGISAWAKALLVRMTHTQGLGILLTGLGTDRMIEAIKLLRNFDMRLGLKEAKDIVTGLQEKSLKEHFIPVQELARSTASQQLKDFLPSESINLNRFAETFSAVGFQVRAVQNDHPDDYPV